MGLELAKAYLTVRVDGSGVGSGLAGIRNEAQAHLAGIERVLLGIMSSISLFTGGLMRSGMSAAAQLEQDLMSFEVMLGSAAEAKRLMDDITQFAIVTPFEMKDIVPAARILATFGERGEELMDTLKYLGDAASATGTKFSLLTIIFNQIRGVGHLITQDFRQLATRGILSLQDIADYYGVSINKASQMISDGAVKFEDVRAIFAKMSSEGGRFANMMARQAKTLNGLLSTVSDAINITIRQIAEGLLPLAKKIAGAIIPATDAVRDFVKATGTLIPYVTTAVLAVTSLTAAILAMRQAMVLLGITMRAVLIGTGWGIALVLLGVAIGTLVHLLEKLIAKFRAGAEGMALWEAAMDRFKAAWLILKDVVQRAWEGIRFVLNQFAEYLGGVLGVRVQELPKLIEDAFAWALDTISTFALEGMAWLGAFVEHWELIWNNAGTIVKAVAMAILDVLSNLDTVMPQIITYALHKAFMAFVQFGKNVLMSFWELLKGLWELVKMIPEIIAAGFSGGAEEMVNKILERPIKKIKGFFKGLEGEAPDLGSIFNLSDETKQQFAQLEDMMKTLQETQRRIKEDALKRVEASKETEPMDLRGRKDEKKPDAGGGLEQGRYGFLEFGQKIQDMLLGSKDDVDKQMLDAIQHGNKVQEQMLDLERGRQVAQGAMGSGAADKKAEEKEMVALMKSGASKTDDLITAVKAINLTGMLT